MIVRTALGLLTFVGVCGGASAQEPRDEPREIARRLVHGYMRGNPPDPARLPLVDRLIAALARTDIDGDVVMRDAENPMEKPEIGWSQRIDHQRARVIVRFSEQGRPGEIEILYDRASGPWLITDIRNRDGRSLRKWLQVPANP